MVLRFMVGSKDSSKSEGGQAQRPALIEAGGPEAQLGAAPLAFGLAFRALRLAQVGGGEEALGEGFAAESKRQPTVIISPIGKRIAITSGRCTIE